MLEKEERLMFNSNDFYKRNIEWMKRKEADDMRKQNEHYRSMMVNGLKLFYNVNSQLQRNQKVTHQ